MRKQINLFSRRETAKLNVSAFEFKCEKQAGVD